MSPEQGLGPVQGFSPARCWGLGTDSGLPYGHRRSLRLCLVSAPLLVPMALIPRWRFMTDEAKALTRRTAVSAGVVLVALVLFRALLPWMLLALAAYWLWKVVGK